MLALRPYHHTIVAIVSCIIAVGWTYATRQMYDYNMPFADVFDVSIFPLIGWSVALFVGYFFANAIVKLTGVQRALMQFVVVCLFYVIAVVVAETVGYHVIGIHNLGTST